MNDPSLNNMLKWSVENSDVSRGVQAAETPRQISVSDREAFDQIMEHFKGPSDAEEMDRNLKVVESEDADAEDKHQAFENFEAYIQNIDNANNMENKEMWTRVIKQLENEDPELRLWAAWCCGTAVQNNVRSQERLLIIGAIPTLVRLATTDSEMRVRKKATTALSSAVRNFQPGLDAAISHVPAEYKPKEELNANDMESVDVLINKLRESI